MPPPLQSRVSSARRAAAWRGLAVLPLALACGVALSGCGKTDSADDAPTPVAEVSTAVVGEAKLDKTVTAYGTVAFAAGGERTLAAPVEARVAQVLAAPGAPVAEGQAVIVLSPSPQTQVDLKKAADDAKTAAEAYARAERLKAAGLDSNADVETARAATVVAQATLASLQQRLDGLTLRAPVKGVVEAITAAPGDLVAAGASLGKLGDLTALRIRLGLEEQSLKAVKAGDPVRLQPTGGGVSQSSVVVALDPQLDPQTRMAGVLVRAPAAGLAPGQPVRGDIVLGQTRAPVVPHQAVYYDQDQPYVLVVQGGVAHRRNVALGPVQGDQVAVVSGLDAGQRIVSEGGASLDDGTRVREAPSAAGGHAPSDPADPAGG